jgi:hypothetical protein
VGAGIRHRLLHVGGVLFDVALSVSAVSAAV